MKTFTFTTKLCLLICLFNFSFLVGNAQSYTLTGIALPNINGSSIDWGDFNNDGNLDFAVSGLNNTTDVTNVYKNNGNNTFTAIGGFYALSNGSVDWGDYNNDGYLDLLLTGSQNATNAVGYVKIYVNNKNGSFSNSVSINGFSRGDARWGDYNNDGLLDFAVAGYAGGNSAKVYKNNGNGTFSVQSGIVLTANQDSKVAWGDFNNDNFIDLVVTDPWSSTIIYKNNGNNTFSTMLTLSSGGNVAIGDYNNDNFLDFAIAGASGCCSGYTGIYKNNSDETFTASTMGMEQLKAGDVDWGDYNNDGLADLLVTGINYSNSAYSIIYKNNGDNTFSNANVSLYSLKYGAIEWGDYNNDGALDILMSGTIGGGIHTYLYKCNSSLINTAPFAPTNVKATVNGSDITFTWDKSTDAETQQNGLSYNLYVYDVGLATYDITPNAFPQTHASNGKLRLAEIGNLQYSSSGFTLKSQSCDSNTRFAVQAIDNGYKGGAFSTEFNPWFYLTSHPQNTLACISKPFSLSVSASGYGGTLSYQWQLNNTNIAGATSASYYVPNASLANQGTYKCIVKSSCAGTLISNSAIVTVNSLPTAIANDDATICTGPGFQLNASGGVTYLWSPSVTVSDTTSANPLAYPLTSTTYMVMVTDVNGCTDTEDVILSTLPSPTSTIAPQGPTTFCSGGQVILNAPTGSGNTYQWIRNNIDINGANTSAYTATLSGNYAVRVTNSNGCYKLSDDTTITVHSLPVSACTANGVTQFCSGGSVGLTATTSTGLTYQWQKNSVNISTATSSAYTATQTGNYRVVTSDANGCSNPSSIIAVTALALPASNISVLSDTTVCQGATVTLLVGTGTNYIYQWMKNGSNITDGTLSSYPATVNGNYTVQVTDEYNCTKLSAPKTITIVAPPIANAGADTSINYGNPGSLHGNSTGGTSPFTYAWTPTDLIQTGATSKNATTKNLTSTTIFTFTVIDSKNCSGSDNLVVNIFGGPLDIGISSSATILCAGTPITLSALPSGGTGNYTYTWSTTPVGYSNTGASIVVTPLESTIYKLVVNDGNTKDSTTVSISVNPVPTANVTSQGALSICADNAVNLDVTTAAGQTYQWQKDGNDITGGNSSSYQAGVTGIYKVIVTNSYSCTDTSSSFNIQSYSLPVATSSAQGTTTFCEGNSVNLQANTGAGLSYQWQRNGTAVSGATGSTYSVTSTGSYKVVVTDANTCSNISFPITVTVNPLPMASVSILGDTTFCQGNAVQLLAAAGTNYIYQWKKNNNNIAGAILSTMIITSSGQYKVLVTDYNNCQKTSETKTITVNSLPVVNAGSDITIKNGSNTSLSASAAGGIGSLHFNWQPTAFIESGATTKIPVTKHLTNSEVFVFSTSDDNGCSANDQVTVNVTGGPLDVNAFTSSTSICAGASVQLYSQTIGGTGNHSYSWSSIPAGFSSSIATPLVTPTVSTTYILVVNDGYYIDTAKVTISLNTIPNAVIFPQGNTTFCSGNFVTLDATTGSGLTYQWKKNSNDINGANASSYVASTPGIYSVELTNIGGCSNISQSQPVIVNALPLSAINTVSSPIFCQGDSAILTANSDTSSTYQWQKNGVTITDATNDTITIKTSGNYNVVITDSNTCSNTATPIAVTANPLPAANISTLGDTTFCQGGAVQLLVGTGSGYNYQWKKNGSDITQATLSSYITLEAGKYSVEVTDLYNCVNTSKEKTITINPLPVANAGGNIGVNNGSKGTLSGSASGGSGKYTYNWTPSAFIESGATSLSATTKRLTNSTVFTLQVKDSLSCNATDNMTVSVLGGALDVAVSANNTVLCKGNSTQLNAMASGGTGTYTYKWTSIPADVNATVAAPIVTPSITSTYQIVVDDGFYKDSSIVIITVNNALSADITPQGDTTFCNGNAVQLDATTGSGYTYQWKKDGNIIQGASSSSYSASTTGDYTVVVSSGGGCAVTSSKQIVTVNALPPAIISANGATAFCQNDSVVLKTNAGIGSSVQWKLNGNAITNADSTIYTAKETGNYQVVITDNNACANVSNIINITANTAPDASITTIGDTTFCQDGSVVLTANSGSNAIYQWKKDGAPITGANISSYIAKQTGNYNVLISDMLNCKSTSRNIQVTTQALPLVNAGADQRINNGANATIKAIASSTAGIDSYNWTPAGLLTSGADSSVAVTKNLTSSTVFTLSVIDSAGCQNNDWVTVAVIGGPLSVTASADVALVCGGNQTSLLAMASGGSGVYSYAWASNPAGLTVDSANPVVAPTVNTTYIVTVSDGYYTQVANLSIAVDEAPVATITTAGFTSVCQGNSVALTATKGTGFTYQWEKDNQLIGGASSSSYNAKQSGDYAVIITNTNACSSKSAKQKVIVNPLPESVITADSTDVCQGKTAILTATYSSTFSYQWKKNNVVIANEKDSALTVNTSGNYSVVITDTNNCSSNSTPVAINVHALPTAIITAIGKTSFCAGSSILLSTNTANGYTYQWNKNNSDLTNEINSTLNVSDSGSYKVIVTDINNCIATATPIKTTVIANPDATITTLGKTTLCLGDTVKLSVPTDANAYYNWKWNGSHISDEISNTINITTGGIYSVLVSNASCNKESTTTTITVNSLPNAIITSLSKTSFCAGSSIVLSTTNKVGSTYQWKKENSSIDNEIKSTLTVSDSGSYSVIVTDVNKCIATSSPIKTTVLANPDATIIIAGKTTMCNGDTVNLSVLDDVNAYYKWEKDGTELTKEITNSLNITIAGQYSVLVTKTSMCKNQSVKTDVIVNSLPSPTILSSNLIYTCISDNTKLSTPVLYSAFNWSTNETTASINVATAGTFTVTVTDANACKALAKIIVTEQMQSAPEICMVSVSELQDFKNNIVTWDHIQGINIDHFNVYKMDQFSNVYQKIGEVPATQDGIFSDLASTPAKRSEFYKISMVDKCAKETSLSVNHKTMHLMRVPGTDTTIINLIWENYEGMDFNSYTIFRGPDIYHMDTLDYVTNLITSYSDLQLPSYRPIYYNVGINLKNICVDGAKAKATEKGPYTMSRSNVEDAGVIDGSDGIAELYGINKFSIYPNPVRNELMIITNVSESNPNYSSEMYREIIITNSLGQIVIQQEFSSQNSVKRINTEQLANGLYYLRIGDEMQKFVVNK